jgi:hypothetical protein
VQNFILQSRNGTVIGEVPDHAKAGFESINKATKEDTTADTLLKQREQEQALQRLKDVQEKLTLGEMLQDFQTEKAQQAAEQAAMLRRANQINEANQVNTIVGLFNAFVFNSKS